MTVNLSAEVPGGLTVFLVGFSIYSGGLFSLTVFRSCCRPCRRMSDYLSIRRSGCRYILTLRRMPGGIFVGFLCVAG